MEDGEKAQGTPAAPAPVFLGQAFGGAQSPVVQSTPQPSPEGANPPIYVKNEPQWGEATPPPTSFRWGQFFIGLIAPIAVSLLFVFVGDLVASDQYDDFYGYEEAFMSPDENGHYSAQISLPPDHELDYCSLYSDEIRPWEEGVFCEVLWDHSLEVRQYLETPTQIQPLAFVIDGENGTFSVSYNGTTDIPNDISGRLFTDTGTQYARIYAAEHETDNASATSYLNSTFTPTNRTLHIYLDAVFFSTNEILMVTSCESESFYRQCNATHSEKGYRMDVDFFGDPEHVTIGELTPSNETLWFIPNGEDLVSYQVNINTYNYELEQTISPAEVVDGIFCMTPFVYVIAIVVSFVKGKTALGWGLLSSALLSILLFLGFIALLILSYGGSF